MINFIGCTCDVCNEKFTEESDVVVCPECGTPHHRECYKKLGHCVNEAKHAEGFEWQAPQKPVNPNTAVCTRCGAENAKDAAFCENCGVALAPANSKSRTAVPPVFPNAKNANSNNFVPPVMDISEEEIDGVNMRDMAMYIGPSYAFYLFNFKRLQQEGKNGRTFCWSAFFFDGIYFLYRKMWLEALVILAVSFILAVPNTIVLMSTMDMLPAAASSLMFEGIEIVVAVCSVLSFALKMLLGFAAVPLYKKKVVKDLKNIKAHTATTNEYYQVLASKAGPSKMVLYATAVIMIAYLFI